MAGLLRGRIALVAYAFAATLLSSAQGADWTFFTRVDGDQPPNAIQIADFNGDGQPDIVATTQVGGQAKLAVLLWTADRQYDVVQPPLNLPGSPKALVIGDFDWDGNLDVAVAFAGNPSGGVAILFGDGRGAFGEPYLFLFDQYPAAVPLDVVAAPFVDGNNIPDLAATISADAGQNFVVVLKNRWSASRDFPRTYIATTAPCPSIAAFRTNQFIDLFVASDRVSRLAGQGNGNFSDPVDIWCPGAGLARVCQAEIDVTQELRGSLLDTATPPRLHLGAFNQGDQRFLGIIDRTVQNFTALHRQPDGGFEQNPEEISLATPPKRLFVGDIGNGQFFTPDGLQDAIILDESDNVTAVFQSASPPFFNEKTQTLSNQFCSSVAMAASAHTRRDQPRLPFVAVTGRRCLSGAAMVEGDSGIGGEGGCTPLCQEH